MSRVKITEDDKLVKLENVSIRDKQLIPSYEITKTDMVDTYIDSEGTITGYLKRKATISVVKLSPEEYFKGEDSNAEGNGKKTKKSG